MNRSDFYSVTNTHRVSATSYHILSTEMLLNMSHVNVTNQNYLDQNQNIPPTKNDSILDMRLGFSTKNSEYRCLTCGCREVDCPGHFGHLILNMPVFHPGYYTQISKILNMLCHNCARVSEPSKCMHCGHQRITYSSQLRILLTPADCLELFERVTEVEFNKLSEFIRRPNKLSDLLIQTLAIPPSCIRPTVFQNGQNCIDKLTQLLHQIQKTNIALIDKSSMDMRLNTWLKLQEDIGSYFGAKKAPSSFFAFVKEMDDVNSLLIESVEDIVVQPVQKTKVTKKAAEVASIVERLKGKEGRFRGNLSGKRVNFTGRSVISPDPNLKADEIGVPYAVSRQLTFPEVVTFENLKAIKELIENDQVESYVQNGAYKNIQQQYSQKTVENPATNQQDNLNKDVFDYQYQYFEREKIVEGKRRRIRYEPEQDFERSQVISLGQQSNSRSNSMFMFSHQQYQENTKNQDTWNKIYQFAAQKGCYDTQFLQDEIDIFEQEKVYKYLEIPTSTLEKKDFLRGREIQPGDIVNRYVQNGDYLLFNRQPSLHKSSICKFKARIHPFKTFKFNVVNCTNFGADFDGDEMNVHLPQLFEAVAECETLLSHEDNLIDCATQNISMNIMQDSISGLYLLSRESYFSFSDYCQYVMVDWQSIGDDQNYLGAPVQTSYFERNQSLDNYNSLIKENTHIDSNDFFEQFYGQPNNLFKQSENIQQPAILFPQQLYTGKQIISQYIQNHTQGNPISYVDNKDSLFILSSTFLQGTLNKKHLGGIFTAVVRNQINQVNSTIRVEKRALDLEFSLQRFALRFMQTYGFSIGIQDVWQSNDFLQKKLSFIEDCFRRLGYSSFKQIEQIWSYPEFRDRLDTSLGKSSERIQDNKILGDLSELRNQLSKEIQNFIYYYSNINHNSTLVMSRSGSKGSIINQVQMTSLLSQQTVNGDFVENFFIDRVLPHFLPGNQHNPYQFGFIQNSFFSGLTPFEFFYHTTSGREGVIDTAVKTARTGYIQRKLSKCLENVIIDWRGNVVEDKIILFNPDTIEPHVVVDKQEIMNLWVSFSDSELTGHELFDKEKLINKLSNLSLQHYLKDQYNFLVQEYMLANKSGPLLKHIIADFVQELCSIISQPYKQCYPHKDEVLHLFNFINTQLYCNDTILHILEIPFDYIKKLIVATRVAVNKFPNWLEPNAPIGLLSSQALGEPTTQMTLKTFHFAGLASKIQGVPRLTQIFNASKNTQADLVLYVNRNVKRSKQRKDDLGLFGGSGQDLEIYVDDRKHVQILGNRIDPLKLSEVAVIKELISSQQYVIQIELNIELLQNLCIPITPQQIQQYICDQLKKYKLDSTMFTILDHKTLQLQTMFKGNREDLTLVTTTLFNDLQYLIINGYVGCDISIQEQKVSDFVSSQYYKYRQQNQHALDHRVLDFGEDEKLFFLTSTTPNKVLQLLNSPEIDPYSSYTRNLFDIQEIFGIEAARQSIVDEVYQSYKDCGFAVSNYMVQVFASYMCASGRILGYSDSGLRINKKGHTILLASFERTDQYLYDAGIKGNKQDSIVDVSEDITFGNCIKLGSGGFQLFWDEYQKNKHDNDDI